MRSATALLLTTGILSISGCSLLIDAKLDDAGTSSGAGGQGGVETTSSIASTAAGSTMSATVSAAQSVSVSASSGGACAPMCMLPNAMSECVDAACVIKMCDSHFGDCNATPGDGCEINFNNDPKNCGGCNQPCMPGKMCKGSNCK